MHIIESSSREVLGAKFWEYFIEALHSQKQSTIIIGLSGGSSLDSFYEVLRMRFREIDGSIRNRICFAFLDERIVPSDHPDSNEGQLRKKFLDELIKNGLIEEGQVIGVSLCPSSRGTKRSRSLDCHVRHPQVQDDSSQGQEQYADEYSQLVPRIDIGLFGVGPDGHIASLFPHHPLLDSSSKSYLEITDSPKPPSHRITASPEMIRAMPHAFIAFMRGKEEVFRRFKDSDISVVDCPVKMLVGCENLVVMSDIDE